MNLLLSNRKTRHTWRQSFKQLPLICFDLLRFCLDGFMLDFWTILKKSFDTWCDLWPTIFNKSFWSRIRSLLLWSMWEKSHDVSGKNPNVCRINFHIFKMIDFESSWQRIIFLCWTKVLFNIFLVWAVSQLIRSVNTSAVLLSIRFYVLIRLYFMHCGFYLFSVQCFFGKVLV